MPEGFFVFFFVLTCQVTESMDADSSDLDKCPVEQKEENPKRKKS